MDNYLNILIIGCDTIGYELVHTLISQNYKGIIYIYDNTKPNTKHSYRLPFFANNFKSLASNLLHSFTENIHNIIIINTFSITDIIEKYNINLIIQTNVSIISVNKVRHFIKNNDITYILACNLGLFGFIYIQSSQYTNSILDENNITVDDYDTLTLNIKNDTLKNHEKFKLLFKYIINNITDEFFYEDNHLDNCFYPIGCFITGYVLDVLLNKTRNISKPLFINFDYLLTSTLYQFKSGNLDNIKLLSRECIESIKKSNILLSGNSQLVKQIVKNLEIMGFCSSSYSNITIYNTNIDENVSSKHIKFIDKITTKILSHQSLIIDIPDNNNSTLVECVRFKLPIISILQKNDDEVDINTHVPDKSFADFKDDFEEQIIYKHNEPFSLIISSIVIVQLIKYLQNLTMYDIKLSYKLDIEISRLRAPNELYMNMYRPEYNMRIYTYPESFNEWTKLTIIQSRDDCYTYDDLLDVLEGDYKIPRIYMEAIYFPDYNIFYRIDNNILQNRIDRLYEKYKLNDTDNLYMNLIAFNEITPILTPLISFTKKGK